MFCFFQTNFYIEFQDNDKNLTESDKANADVVETVTSNSSDKNENTNETEIETNESEQNATDVVESSATVDTEPIDNANV